IGDCAAGHVRTPRTRCRVGETRKSGATAGTFGGPDLGADALRAHKRSATVATSVSRARAGSGWLARTSTFRPLASGTRRRVDTDGRTTRSATPSAFLAGARGLRSTTHNRTEMTRMSQSEQKIVQYLNE